MYGINKMYLMMEKQHNRGQDGAGLACVKLNMSPGQRYIAQGAFQQSTTYSGYFQKGQ